MDTLPVLVQDPKRLLVAACVLNRWSFEEILDIYVMDHTECIRHLAALDKIRFIELLPAPRVRIVVTVFFLSFTRREAIGDETCRDIRCS